MTEKSPIRPTDDAARDTARGLIATARTAALGVTGADGAPMVTRIAFATGPDATPLTLISDLSGHTAALRDSPACSLLVGDVAPRGDPLNQPRLTLQARARLVANGTADYDALVPVYLALHPKAKLYIGFADFNFALFDVTEGHLNGGFGKAYRLSSSDLGLRG